MPKEKDTAEVPIVLLKRWEKLLIKAGINTTTISDYIPQPDQLVLIQLSQLRQARDLAGAGGRAENYLNDLIHTYEKMIEEAQTR